jgi:hypothetical protein
MPFRVSFQFRVQQALAGGWTENFWNLGNDGSVVANNATALRLKLLSAKGYPIQCPTIRISDLSGFRVVKKLRFPDIRVPTTFNPDLFCDFVTTAYLLKLTGTTAGPPAIAVVNNQWFRGGFDGDVTNGGYYVPTAGTVNVMNRLFSEITSGANGWALRVNTRSAAKMTVTAISQAGVVSCTGHGLNTDDKTRLSRVVSPTSLNKIWKVVRISADTFSLVGPPSDIPSTGATVGLNTTSQKQLAQYLQITSATVDRATEHRTGRPTELLIGRRRTRR